MAKPYVIFVCGAVIAAGSTAGAAPPAKSNLDRYEYTEQHMGSAFKVVLYAADEATANVAAKAAFARVAAINSIMSDYDDESELMRLCRAGKPGQPIPISEDLLAVLVRGQRLAAQTDGAFDVTVGPMSKLWRRSKRLRELPRPERIEEARQLVGFRLLKLDEKGKTAELLREGMQLDLGGIAKGYAADQAMAELAKRGIKRALVAASGDVLASEAPPDDNSWRVGIAPLEAEAAPSRYLRLKCRAVSTSGDAFQFVEIAGQRYSHIVDPRTGLGLIGRSSVTVVAPDSTTADSLATAVSVLGPKRGVELVDSLPDTAALVVRVDDAGKLETIESAKWKELKIELP